MQINQNEWQIILLTLQVAALAVAAAFPAALAVGWMLAVRVRGHHLLSAAASLPLALPPVVIGWLLLILCDAQGPIGAWLQMRFDIHLAFTTQGAALACAVMVFPLLVRAIRRGIEAVDPDVLAVARSLGAGAVDRFISVTIPLCGPGLLLAVVTGLAASAGEFGAVIIFAANIPGQTQTLPLAIYAALQSPTGQAEAASLALCSAAFALLGVLATELLGRRLPR